MKLSICIFLVFISFMAEAGPFPNLTKENIAVFDDKKHLEMNIHFQPALFRRIGKTRNEFPGNHPQYTDEYGFDDIVLGIFDLTGQDDNYYVVFSMGPSFDVKYCFYNEKHVQNAIETEAQDIACDFEIYALSLIIPGNGNLYSYGHNDTMADTRQKYTLHGNVLEEVSQPFYYIGMKSRSVKAQLAYTDESLTSVAFRLTADYSVTVVGFLPKYKNKRSNMDLYLVASEFGLMGWVPSENLQTESQFEGFYFNGD